jgi:hypothetical protein
MKTLIKILVLSLIADSCFAGAATYLNKNNNFPRRRSYSSNTNTTTPATPKEVMSYVYPEEPVVSKFYINVKLPSGHQTKIPVINATLPRVQEFNDNGKISINLDYKRGYPFIPQQHAGKTINYGLLKERKPVPIGKPIAPLPTPKPAPAAEPTKEGLVEKIKELREELQILEKQLEELEGKTTPIPVISPVEPPKEPKKKSWVIQPTLR